VSELDALHLVPDFETYKFKWLKWNAWSEQSEKNLCQIC